MRRSYKPQKVHDWSGASIDMGHRDSSSERAEFQQACSAGHRASSEARGEVCSQFVTVWCAPLQHRFKVRCYQ